MFRPSARALVLASALFSTGLGSAHAADYFLHQNQGAGWNWSTTAAGNTNSWYNARTGGSIVTSMDAAGTYYTNGFQLRTPQSSSSASFPGAKLVLESGSSLALKMTNGSAVASVANFETQGSTTISTADGNHYHSLSLANFDQAGTTLFNADSGRSFNLTFADLDGNGTINLVGGATTSNFNLAITDASGFSGAFNFSGGALVFANDFSTAGSFTISSGIVNLNHSISVSALTIAGSPLANGTYSYATLNALYGSIFTAGNASGQFIVGTAIPEPANAVLGLGAVAGIAACLRRRRR